MNVFDIKGIKILVLIACTCLVMEPMSLFTFTIGTVCAVPGEVSQQKWEQECVSWLFCRADPITVTLGDIWLCEYVWRCWLQETLDRFRQHGTGHCPGRLWRWPNGMTLGARMASRSRIAVKFCSWEIPAHIMTTWKLDSSVNKFCPI